MKTDDERHVNTLDWLICLSSFGNSLPVWYKNPHRAFEALWGGACLAEAKLLSSSVFKPRLQWQGAKRQSICVCGTDTAVSGVGIGCSRTFALCVAENSA